MPHLLTTFHLGLRLFFVDQRLECKYGLYPERWNKIWRDRHFTRIVFKISYLGEDCHCGGSSRMSQPLREF